VIICNKCGHHNQDQDRFCASCDAFLEFHGRRVVEEAPPPPPPVEAAPPPPPAGIVDRVKQAVGVPPAPTQPPRPPSPADGGWSPPGAQGPPPPAVSTPPAPPAAAPAPPAAPAAPAAPLGARQPEATAQTARPRPQPAPPPRQETVETGVFCSRCGTGNDVRRHFCRHCGEPLAQVRPVRVPWYRRLLPRRRQPEAGERPTSASGATLGSVLRMFVVTVLAVLVAGGVLLYAAVPSFRQAANRQVDRVATDVRRLTNPGVVELHPTSTRASSELTGHPARYAADLVRNDYWAADVARDRNPTLVFTFDGPTDLDNLLVTSGASGPAGNEFAQSARPRTVELTYSDGTGETLQLQDTPTAADYTVHARQTTFVTMRITSVYPVSGTTIVALTEVEFFHLK
jgi:hypothetical protein